MGLEIIRKNTGGSDFLNGGSTLLYIIALLGAGIAAFYFVNKGYLSQAAKSSPK